MSLLRLVIAWLLMAALPLQGMAAASMLFCDQAAHATAGEAAHERAGHQHARAAASSDGHDHHAVSGHHEHSDAVATAGNHVDSAKAGKAAGDHACPICASCCNVVAISETPMLNLEAARPAPPALQGPVRVLTRDAPAPEKPPRA